ncbi:cell division protein FtsL [Oceanobacillus profundus]|uniref:Cell division protein FtsL n=1 Tax=Oceanobacillus profundus TaxID=372463 RepID=A0A417YKD9_9BACI|nr:cell division protein FtsL [Oceanobacillus profundus]MBR3119394.1 cell division protein FtsL [Oceanobacillus sp.]PAE30131.1 cell division protein FtsL [Paenibacillus sp. 7884-2]MCM3396244.1 cell division protein FtsL [Oceanobacillus profundus]MDO6449746.1 cell division protein FtsL [Oceanobacillus profundus]RHW33748.1 cell division protein FtsL [Oceanobacillus profundus]
MSANGARNWQQINPQYTPNTEKEKKVSVKVKNNGWITKGEKVIYSFIGACLVISGIYMVSFSSTTDTINRELQQLEQTVNTQQVTNDGLMFEVKELSRPERIIEIADKNGLKIQNAEVKQAQTFNN